MSPCSLNHFLLLYVIRPPTAASCCFSSAIYGSDVCFFLLYYCCHCVVLLFLFLSLCLFVSTYRSRYLPGSLSITSSRSIPLRLLRDRLLLALVSFRYPFFSFFFCSGTYLRFSLLLFLCSFFSLLLLLHHCHHFLFLFLAVSICFLWQFFHSPPSLALPSYSHSLPCS